MCILQITNFFYYKFIITVVKFASQIGYLCKWNLIIFRRDCKIYSVYVCHINSTKSL